MLEYIIKSSACLAVFLLIYKSLLEKENMHVFKRFYLLVCLLVSFGIPLITFTQYIEVPLSINNTVINKESLASLNPKGTSVNYITYILWSIYFLGALIFSFKFILNLNSIVLKIKQNPKLKTNKSTNVLLKELIVPHTFLNYIFLNKTRYEAQLIPEEVLIHEEVHAVQKHSLDILFIELFQIIFWFNPLIYLLKKSIKLNHEFLADQEVIKKGVTLSKYQQILLAFSSNALEPQLATAINYSFIKKRFTVMKTHTSKTRIWFRSLVLLPVLALLIFSFSTKKVIQIETKSFSEITNNVQQKASPEELSEYNKLAKKYNAQPESKRVVKLQDLERMEYIYKKMSKEQKATAEPFPNCPPPPPNAPEIKMADLPPPPPIPANATPEEKAKYQKTINEYNEWHSRVVKKGEKSNIPPPPPPKSPIEHIKEMEKKGATFYYENEKITAKKAVELLKNNDKLNILTRGSKTKKPIVKLKIEPITIDD